MSDYQVPIRQSPENFRRKMNAILAALNERTTAIESMVRSGAGSPEGNVAAPKGTAYLRSDGGANTTLYVKESGTGTSGWVAK
ncbi:hypothetical protein [Caulobacter sp. UC70_42]|uniref:hypothetical protein n=1 Tax=Caulobacter sp. UC70_42 TaxID=3374551 RepID=UPI003756D11B